jgi:hypothetical protein
MRGRLEGSFRWHERWMDGGQALAGCAISGTAGIQWCRQYIGGMFGMDCVIERWGSCQGAPKTGH